MTVKLNTQMMQHRNPRHRLLWRQGSRGYQGGFPRVSCGEPQATSRGTTQATHPHKSPTRDAGTQGDPLDAHEAVQQAYLSAHEAWGGTGVGEWACVDGVRGGT